MSTSSKGGEKWGRFTLDSQGAEVNDRPVYYTVRNRSRNSVALGDRVVLAQTLLTRLVGLMGRAQLAPGEGLHLVPCNAIHMAFMRFAIDVLFLDGELRVVGAVHAVRPFRVTRRYAAARSALELPQGTLRATGTEVGDRLLIELSQMVRSR